MSETAPLRVGQTLIGPLFNEPMRVETVSAAGNSSWVVGLVGAQSERFRRVTMSESDLAAISKVEDVHEQDLGYDITSLDLKSGDLRLMEIKGIGAAEGSVMLSPNELKVATDRRDCYWLYVVTHCNTKPQLREPIRDPARLEWVKVTKVAHYRIDTRSLG
jgi:hypothetical protein